MMNAPQSPTATIGVVVNSGAGAADEGVGGASGAMADGDRNGDAAAPGLELHETKNSTLTQGTTESQRTSEVHLRPLRMWKMFIHFLMKMHKQRMHSHALHLHRIEEHERAGKRLSKRIFGIGPDNSHLPASRLIHPFSPFGIAWMLMTAFFLAYTAVITPPVIAFHWLDKPCVTVPTLPMDVVVDVFFLCDICLSFFTGRLIGGEYDDEWKSIVKAYIYGGGFAFDVLTSFPVSFFELSVAQACGKADKSLDDGTTSVDSGQLRLIRVLKPLRFMKIIRILKLSKLGFIVDILSDRFNISPKGVKATGTFFQLVFVIHISGCLWWLYKVLNIKEAEELTLFMQGNPWGLDPAPEIETAKGKFGAYIISTYLVTMTLTTVGYGDITADNTAERIGYIFLFIGGAFVWGTLLAEVGEIHASSSARAREKMEKVQQMLDFLMDNDCPPALRVRIIQYTRFAEVIYIYRYT